MSLKSMNRLVYFRNKSEMRGFRRLRCHLWSGASNSDQRLGHNREKKTACNIITMHRLPDLGRIDQLSRSQSLGFSSPDYKRAALLRKHGTALDCVVASLS